MIRTLWILLLLASAPASAHEYWLQPSRYHADAGDSIAVGGFVGTGFRGEARPYSARRAVRFLARGAAPVDLARTARDGLSPWVRFRAGDRGGTLVAYESDFATIELPAHEFESYLRLEGLDAVVRARAAAGASRSPGRERYRRSCKVWIAGTAPGATRATVALGLPLEIVPAAEPGAAGSDRLGLIVRFAGRPLAGALVRAWRQPPGADGGVVSAAARDSVGSFAEGRTDGEGLVVLRLPGPGEWLVSTVHMVPAAGGRGDADWESTWASLTFAVPERY
jgi:uncharacterized GH25 family protein